MNDDNNLQQPQSGVVDNALASVGLWLLGLVFWAVGIYNLPVFLFYAVLYGKDLREFIHEDAVRISTWLISTVFWFFVYLVVRNWNE